MLNFHFEIISLAVVHVYLIMIMVGMEPLFLFKRFHDCYKIPQYIIIRKSDNSFSTQSYVISKQISLNQSYKKVNVLVIFGDKLKCQKTDVSRLLPLHQWSECNWASLRSLMKRQQPRNASFFYILSFLHFIFCTNQCATHFFQLFPLN